MLSYTEVKRYEAELLLADLTGTGRIEAAHYKTMKMVYLKGVEDGLASAGLPDEEIKRIIGIIDGKTPTNKDTQHD